MDESGEAIEGGRGISLKRMLRAYSRHCTSNIAISNEKVSLYSQWQWSCRGIVQDEKGLHCMASN